VIRVILNAGSIFQDFYVVLLQYFTKKQSPVLDKPGIANSITSSSGEK